MSFERRIGRIIHLDVDAVKESGHAVLEISHAVVDRGSLAEPERAQLFEQASSIVARQPIFHAEQRPDEEPAILLPRQVFVHERLGRLAVQQGIYPR